MPTYHLSRQEINGEQIQRLLSATFSGYDGHQIKITIAVEVSIDTMWSGGTHRDWFLVRRDGEIFQEYSLDARESAGKMLAIPPNSFMVTRDYFCGKDMGVTIYVRADEWNTGLLVDMTQDELTWEEKVVLCATRTYKSSYAGIPNYRYYEAHHYTNISLDSWNEAMQSLMDKKMLAKNKAITAKGRNSIGDIGLMSLKDGGSKPHVS